MTEIIICDRCAGYGVAEYDIGTHKSKYVQVKCSQCDGTGRIVRINIIKQSAFDPKKGRSQRIF